MPAANQCPTCQAELPVGAPAGLCPACLLKAGITSDHVEAGTRTSRSTFTPPSPAELAPHFPQLEILELIGQGGMGAVYKARQARLDRIVALKVLPKDAEKGQEFADRFTREAKAMARLSHPNIIAIHDYGEVAGWFYFVMEYVDGVNLRQAMKGTTIQPVEALAMVGQICDALQYAHEENIVHRDIKPENILLTKKGRVKIADFGLAKLMGLSSVDRHLTATQQVMGTIGYMAPEQMEGSKTIDHRADIYALGVVFYELLTGELPMGRFAPPSQKVQIDVRFDEVVLKTLEKEPSRRYQSASQVKHEMERISAVPGAAPLVSPTPTISSPTSTRLTLLGSALLMIGIVELAAGLASFFSFMDVQTRRQFLRDASAPAVQIGYSLIWADFLGMSWIVIASGILLLLRRAWGLAVFGTLAAMLPLASVGAMIVPNRSDLLRDFNFIQWLGVAGIPLGIWGFVELIRPESKASFRWSLLEPLKHLRRKPSAPVPHATIAPVHYRSLSPVLEYCGIAVCVLSCILFWPFYDWPLRAMGFSPRFVVMSSENWIKMLTPSVVTGLFLIIIGPVWRQSAFLGLGMLIGGLTQIAVTLMIVRDAPIYLNTWFMLILGAALGLLGAWRLRWWLSGPPPHMEFSSQTLPSPRRWKRWLGWSLATVGLLAVGVWLAIATGWLTMPGQVLVQSGEFSAGNGDQGTVFFAKPYERIPNLELNFASTPYLRVVNTWPEGFEWKREKSDFTVSVPVTWTARGERAAGATLNQRRMLIDTWKEIDGSDVVTFKSDGTFHETSNTGVSQGSYRWIDHGRLFVHDPAKQPRELKIMIDHEMLTVIPINGRTVRFQKVR